MTSAQNPFEKIKAIYDKLASDKPFLMVCGVSAVMVLIFGFWIFSLRSSFISNPPTVGLTKNLDELKDQFQARMSKTESLLKAVEAKQQAKADAADSLNKNMDSLVHSIDKAKASSTIVTADKPASSTDQNIEALKSQLLKIETDLKR